LGGDAVGAGIDRAVGALVALDQPLDLSIAHGNSLAGNDSRVEEQARCRRHRPRPAAVGVNDHLGGAIGMEIVEQAMQDALGLGN
jgi:hypothetical protein